MALQFLKKKGYSIRHKNFRSKFGEIDLIAENDKRLVFIEVKSLHFSNFFSPEDHFNYQKQRKQVLLAKHYLSTTNQEVNVRFDLITVVKKGRDFFIEHYEDVIHE